MRKEGSPMGTVERRVELMKLLCKRRYETMSNLAAEFGVSIRTIKRDIDELGSFIPLVTKSGRYDGGVYVMEDYRWDKAYMSAEEIALLTKIKTIGTSKQRLIFEGEDLHRLERIIATYSLPQVK